MIFDSIFVPQLYCLFSKKVVLQNREKGLKDKGFPFSLKPLSCHLSKLYFDFGKSLFSFYNFKVSLAKIQVIPHNKHQEEFPL
jgi:hypothetical protein